MHNISKDNRRATRDLDLDFIKYSLDDKSIKAFIEKLNYPKTDISIKIIGRIEELSHQDYNGKRVYIEDQIFKMDTVESNRRFTKKTLQSWIYDFINLIKS